ncbi:hypothetical protein M885DRAFT_608808 [Pelagophyceae sp. CCMP2097]|nr:hypothetical protein M885DRAFT_608808 [Pelagophyceae sp. CCMP2097]
MGCAWPDEFTGGLVDVPLASELVGLTTTEERLIALVNPHVIVFALMRIGVFTHGNVVFYQRDVIETAIKIPRTVDELGLIYIRDRAASGAILEAKVHPERVFRALEYLLEHNHLYQTKLSAWAGGVQGGLIDKANMGELFRRAAASGTKDDEGCLYFVINPTMNIGGEGDRALRGEDEGDEEEEKDDDDYDPLDDDCGCDDGNDDDDAAWSDIDEGSDAMHAESDGLEQEAQRGVTQVCRAVAHLHSKTGARRRFGCFLNRKATGLEHKWEDRAKS